MHCVCLKSDTIYQNTFYKSQDFTTSFYEMNVADGLILRNFSNSQKFRPTKITEGEFRPAKITEEEFRPAKITEEEFRPAKVNEGEFRHCKSK